MFIILCKRLPLNHNINALLISNPSLSSCIRCLSSSSENIPDSVFNFYRDNGFNDTQISTALASIQSLVKSNLERTILPKIEFLRSIGVSKQLLPELVAKHPWHLVRSLNKHTIPCYHILKSILLSDDKVVSLFRRLSSYDVNGVKTNLVPNVTRLRELGMPEGFIATFLLQNNQILCSKVEKFNVAVEKTISMGFNPVTYTFLRAVQVQLQMSEKTWEVKLNVFRSWGLDEDQFWVAFRKHPVLMTLSRETMAKKMDFLVNKMGLKPDVVIRNPVVLCYSLEKRIVPRCSVMKILFQKGLMKRELSLDSVLVVSNKHFLDKFVKKHLEKVPELMDVLQGKVDHEMLGFGFDQKQSASII
ncbi:Mitochondrial transcription termination factor family protein [Euphorbia peplus]|nr:Mitochondrial transcription termination factor family protein [Euphorbia peplus]